MVLALGGRCSKSDQGIAAKRCGECAITKRGNVFAVG